MFVAQVTKLEIDIVELAAVRQKLAILFLQPLYTEMGKSALPFVKICVIFYP